MSEWIQALLIIMGGIFVLIAGIGIVRLPDVLCRAHALSKALTLGVNLMLLALLGLDISALAVLKIVLAIAFQFLTIPIVGHIIAVYATSSNK